MVEKGRKTTTARWRERTGTRGSRRTSRKRPNIDASWHRCLGASDLSLKPSNDAPPSLSSVQSPPNKTQVSCSYATYSTILGRIMPELTRTACWSCNFFLLCACIGWHQWCVSVAMYALCSMYCIHKIYLSVHISSLEEGRM